MKKLIFLISLCLLSQNYTIANTDTLEETVPVPIPAIKTEPKPKTNNINAPSYVQQKQLKLLSTRTQAVQAISGIPPVPVNFPEVPETKETKTIVNKQPTNVQPKTNHPEYIQTTPEQQKYKIFDNKKLQEKENPIPEKQLNLWAEKSKKYGRPPVIAEDNLSDPNDTTVLKVNLKKIEFTESNVFTEEDLQTLAAPLLSQPVTIEDIKKVVDGITRCYILGNYATSKAYLPPQDISNGTLKIGLFEGTVGKVTVKNNRWTKRGYIENRITLNEGEIFNLEDLEKDVIKFNNNNNSIKVRVGLSAGANKGETDVTLNAEEDFPFHVAFMTDNQGRQTIGTTRWGGMLAADSLLGHRDRMSLGGFLGKGNRVGFIDYNFPLNKYGTRLGASISAGNIDVVRGPLRQFGIGGTSQVYSVYLTHPLIDKQDFNFTSYTASNIKRSTTDISGYKLPTLSTFSVTQGFHAKKDTEKGIWYTGHYGVAGFEALGGDEDFFKYEGNITRLHDFGHGIIGQFRLSGQYSPERNLPWLEQFQIGGLSTVRGYSEATLLGRSGYFASAEIMTPLPFLPKAIGSDKLGYIYPREMIKGAIFMDNGMIFPYKYGQAIDSNDLLMSWGLGLRVNLKKDLAARFYWGFGLTNKYDVDQRMGRFHFDITCAPDIGKIVAGRTPKAKKKKESL